jgi:hypothetical protein
MALIKRNEVGTAAANAFSIPQIPEQVYDVRVLNAKGEIPADKAPRIVLEVEVFNPEEVKNAETGAPIVVGGLKFKYYLTFTEKATSSTFETFDKLGIQCDEIDSEDQDSMDALAAQFDDLEFSAILSSEVNTKTVKDSHNPDPKERGKYIPLLGNDGKPVKMGFKLKSASWDIIGAIAPSDTGDAGDGDDEF